MSEPRRAVVLPALDPYLDRRQTLALFVFVVVAFMLLAYRSEVAINRTDENVYQGCLQRIEISKLTGTEPTSDCRRLR